MAKFFTGIVFILWLGTLGAVRLSISEFEQRIFEHTNRERVRHNLPALIYEPGLADLARGHSRNMLHQDFFDHTDRQGLQVGGRQERLYPQIMLVSIGENLYKIEDSRKRFSSQEIVQGWMESPGHRANILNRDFTHIGVGVVVSGRKLFATQNFGTPIVKLITPLPLRTRANRLSLDFEYLSPRPGRDLVATIRYPDASVKFFVNDNEYLEGAEIQSPSWRGGKRFTLTVTFPAGRGDYRVQFGWGNTFYDNGFLVQKL